MRMRRKPPRKVMALLKRAGKMWLKTHLPARASFRTFAASLFVLKQLWQHAKQTIAQPSLMARFNHAMPTAWRPRRERSTTRARCVGTGGSC